MHENPFLTDLRKALASQDKQQRRRAVTQLRGVGGDAALPLLLTALVDSEWEVRALAVNVLAHIDKPEVVDGLLGALATDRSARVRQASAQALGQLHNAGAVPGLLAALDDTSRGVRRAVVRALRDVHAREALPGLIGALLGDADSFVRFDAAKALAALADADALPALEEALRADDNSYVRWASATALVTLGDPVALPTLVAALDDESSHVRHAIARGLGTLALSEDDPQAVRALLRLLNDPSKHVWEAAAEGLWSLGEGVMPHILHALQADDMPTRRAALKAFLWLSAEFDETDVLDADDEDDGFASPWGWWN